MRRYLAEWHERNPGKARQYSRDTYQRLKGTGRWVDACAIRRARRAGNGPVEQIQREEVYERDGGKCHICGKKRPPDDWHLDHLVPLSQGGTHTYTNVAVACPKCNLSKWASGPAQLRLGILGPKDAGGEGHV